MNVEKSVVMKIGKVNQSTWKIPAPVPLCPPQIPQRPNLGSSPVPLGGKITNRLRL
jgi:hypothetical protein